MGKDKKNKGKKDKPKELVVKPAKRSVGKLTEIYGKRITLKKCEGNEYIVMLKRNLHKKTFDKICRTIDEGIQSNEFLSTAILLGHRSRQPVVDVEHVWNKVSQYTGGELSRLALGCLLRWRMVIHVEKSGEDWNCYTQQTEEIDPHTLKKITRTYYFKVEVKVGRK